MHVINRNIMDKHSVNKTDDILYYHNKILTYIKLEKSKIHIYEQLYIELCIECYNSIDMYGILEEDRQFVVSEIHKILNTLLSSDKKSSKKISYKDFKIYIKQIKSIRNHIDFITNQDMIYIVNISPIIERYKQLIQKPISENFIGKKKTETNQDAQSIFNDFFEMVQKSFPSSILQDIFGDLYKTNSKLKLKDPVNRHVYFAKIAKNNSLTTSVFTVDLAHRSLIMKLLNMKITLHMMIWDVLMLINNLRMKKSVILEIQLINIKANKINIFQILYINV